MNKLAAYISIAVLSMTFCVNSYAENKKGADVAIAKAEKSTPAVEAKTSMMRPESKKSFKDVDINSDDKISLDELLHYQEKQKNERAEKEIKKMLAQCDKNKDGMISKNELTKEEDMEEMMNQVDIYDEEAMEKRMAEQCMFPQEAMDFLDENGDGSLTREEILLTMHTGRRPSKKEEAKREEKMQKRDIKRKQKQFTVCDTNADAVLSLREVVSMKCGMHMFTEEFDRRDVDKSDYLNIEELTAYMKPLIYRMPGEPSDAERRRKAPPLMRLETAMYECDTDEDGRLGKHETIEANCKQDMLFFDQVDHNQDGYVSDKELQRQRMKKQFDRMDKNKDGVLDRSEFKGRLASRYFY